jgi:3-dehydroquinate synthase
MNMQIVRQTFQVEYSYPVFFTEDIFSRSNDALAGFFRESAAHGFQRKALIVLDAGVLTFYPELKEKITEYFSLLEEYVRLVPEFVVVDGGEQSKNDPVYFDRIIRAVNDFGIDRHSFLIGIGGGAVLDMAGFAAAVAHRGVRHIRIPTTVLSQNDSGVGVKNSINYKGKKNFVGTFCPPVAVFNDSDFLKSLDDRDWRSGISEAIKVALIKDAVFFEWIEANADRLAAREGESMNYLIKRCAEMHVEHIRSGDPFEFGSSRPLDFGHWAAHKLEYLTNFEVRHGEAVAIGIALDSAYSVKVGRLSADDLERIVALFYKLGFSLYHTGLSENNKANLNDGLNEFREHLGGQLTIMLLDRIGKGVEVHEMDRDLVAQAVDYLEQKERETAGGQGREVTLN